MRTNIVIDDKLMKDTLRDVAIKAAINFRHLRSIGVTVRKNIGCVIATRCIVGGHSLLHDDRDFDSFELYLGLRVVGRNAS